LSDEEQNESSLTDAAIDLFSDFMDARRNSDGQVETPLLDLLRSRRRNGAQDANSSSTDDENTTRRRGFLRRRGS
jgi:hypothetical protein